MDKTTEAVIRGCEYQIDYWLERENLEAVEMYARIRKELREEASLMPDELDRTTDERD